MLKYIKKKKTESFLQCFETRKKYECKMLLANKEEVLFETNYLEQLRCSVGKYLLIDGGITVENTYYPKENIISISSYLVDEEVIYDPSLYGLIGAMTSSKIEENKLKYAYEHSEYNKIVSEQNSMCHTQS